MNAWRFVLLLGLLALNAALFFALGSRYCAGQVRGVLAEIDAEERVLHPEPAAVVYVTSARLSAEESARLRDASRRASAVRPLRCESCMDHVAEFSVSWDGIEAQPFAVCGPCRALVGGAGADVTITPL